MRWSVVNKMVFIILPGKTKKGGILFPVADTASAGVANVPRSADVEAPVCFIPLLAIILCGS